MEKDTLCGILSKALDIEEEGRDFYIECFKKTSDENGKKMFKTLAEDELRHYNRIAEIFESHMRQGYCDYLDSKGKRKKSGIFESDIPGAAIDEASDALEALNIGINAENNSINLYSRLADDAQDDTMKTAFIKLTQEEQKHKSILEQEVEFIMQTGQFSDFKQVTS